MRLRRPLAALAVAAVVAVPACDTADDAALAPLPAAGPAAPPPFEPPARLCDAIPDRVVAAATGRSPVTVDGAGTQCSWRAPAPDGDGDDLVLQGTFIDARSFEVGRSVDTAVTPVADLGDDAYLVRVDGTAPATLYVREGTRAFALWLTAPADGAAEGALARLARQVLSS